MLIQIILALALGLISPDYDYQSEGLTTEDYIVITDIETL